MSSKTLDLVVVFVTVGALIVLCVRRYAQQTSTRLLPAAAERQRKARCFFHDPTPLPSLTVDTLLTSSAFAGARDHIYANKVLRQPYHQTMSHIPMQNDDWLEIDGDYVFDLAEKKRLIEVQGKVVMDIVDDAQVRLACQELMEHVVKWVARRYPALFAYDEEKAKIVNRVTKDSIPLLNAENGRVKDGVEALEVVSRLVQDDFLISSPMPNGNWLCAGGLVCFPGFYLLSEKIGTTLMKTHEPVPQFNQKLLMSVERTLTRLEHDAPIERCSWEIVDSDEQFWVPMAGPLPTSTGAKPMKEYHVTGRKDDACRSEDPSNLTLRLDHQTFVKMPKSGVVFFGVHPFRRRLSALRQSPLLPRLLLDIHRSGPADLMKYKAAPRYEKSVIPYLESLDEWQQSVGLVRPGDRVQDFRLHKDRRPAAVQA